MRQLQKRLVIVFQRVTRERFEALGQFFGSFGEGRNSLLGCAAFSLQFGLQFRILGP